MQNEVLGRISTSGPEFTPCRASHYWRCIVFGKQAGWCAECQGEFDSELVLVRNEAGDLVGLCADCRFSRPLIVIATHGNAVCDDFYCPYEEEKRGIPQNAAGGH